MKPEEAIKPEVAMKPEMVTKAEMATTQPEEVNLIVVCEFPSCETLSLRFLVSPSALPFGAQESAPQGRN